MFFTLKAFDFKVMVDNDHPSTVTRNRDWKNKNFEKNEDWKKYRV